MKRNTALFVMYGVLHYCGVFRSPAHARLAFVRSHLLVPAKPWQG